MKMRGYSVLFVSAFCVFVLCGAAAVVVVAQDVAPEKKAAAEVAKKAKQNGEDALGNYKGFNSKADTVADLLKTAKTKIEETKRHRDSIDDVRDKAKLKVLKAKVEEKVVDVKEKAGKAEEAVRALKNADVASLGEKKEELKTKMEEVEGNMTALEAAAAAVTDKTPATEDVIAKAEKLQKASEEVSGLWGSALRELSTQLEKVKGAFDALTVAGRETKTVIEELKKNTDENTPKVTAVLQAAVDKELKDSLAQITDLQAALQGVKETAEKAKKDYDELAGEAKRVKQAAEEKKTLQGHGSQQQSSLGAALAGTLATQTEDYSAGPLCSLALPAFFFCCCVLFGI